MPLILTALAALSLTPPLAPPPSPRVVFAPNGLIVPQVVTADGRPTRTYVFEVAIRRGGEMLWQGRLAVAGGGSATYSQNIQQTAACAVSTPWRRGYVQAETSVRLSLNGGYENGDPPSFQVAGELKLPASDRPEAQCGNDVTRGVSLSASVRPEPGKPVTLTGDAGFAVTLILRQP